MKLDQATTPLWPSSSIHGPRQHQSSRGRRPAHRRHRDGEHGHIDALGAAVLGYSDATISMLANLLGEHDEEIPAGSLTLSGAITEAMTVKAADKFSLRVQNMGNRNSRFH